MWLEQKEPGPLHCWKENPRTESSTLSLQAVAFTQHTMQRLAAGAAAATGRAAAAGAGALGTCRGLAYRPSVSPSAPGRQGLMGFGGMVSALGLSRRCSRVAASGGSIVPPASACRPVASLLLDAPGCLPAQELTRGNLLALAVGAACTVWLYDFLYEEREAQQRSPWCRRPQS